jgi:hypothetical protein
MVEPMNGEFTLQGCDRLPEFRQRFLGNQVSRVHHHFRGSVVHRSRLHFNLGGFAGAAFEALANSRDRAGNHRGGLAIERLGIFLLQKEPSPRRGLFEQAVQLPDGIGFGFDPATQHVRIAS